LRGGKRTVAARVPLALTAFASFISIWVGYWRLSWRFEVGGHEVSHSHVLDFSCILVNTSRFYDCFGLSYVYERDEEQYKEQH